ncbi:MAG: late competence development ComFB family protein [Tissierellia bacterium]|nr:late competence development ComFB family protein [Tissierellia bacterium]
MKIHNLLEDEVFHLVKDLLKDRKDICTCSKCRMDIAAITLNNLKPKYVVTEKGSIYAKIDTLNYQFDADLIKEITKAIEIVGNKPKHE